MVHLREHILLVILVVGLVALVVMGSTRFTPSSTASVNARILDRPSPAGEGIYRTTLELSWEGSPVDRRCAILVLAFDHNGQDDAWHVSVPKDIAPSLYGQNIWADISPDKSEGRTVVSADLLFESIGAGEVIEALLLCDGEVIARDDVLV